MSGPEDRKRGHCAVEGCRGSSGECDCRCEGCVEQYVHDHWLLSARVLVSSEETIPALYEALAAEKARADATEHETVEAIAAWFDEAVHEYGLEKLASMIRRGDWKKP